MHDSMRSSAWLAQSGCSRFSHLGHRRIHRLRLARLARANVLKRDMVARGYTAGEIIAVVRCKRRGKGEEKLPDVPPAKPVRQPAYG